MIQSLANYTFGSQTAMALDGVVFSPQSMVPHDIISLPLALSGIPSPFFAGLFYTSFKILHMFHSLYKAFTEVSI